MESPWVWIVLACTFVPTLTGSLMLALGHLAGIASLILESHGSAAARKPTGRSPTKPKPRRRAA